MLEAARLNDNVRRIPQPPTATREWLIAAVLVTVIVAVVAVLLLGALGAFSG